MLEVALVNVLLKVLVDWSVVLSPPTLALDAAIHLNVEGALAVKGILTVPPLHTEAVLLLVITGAGFTVTTTELLPGQSVAGSANGSVYVTV